MQLADMLGMRVELGWGLIAFFLTLSDREWHELPEDDRQDVYELVDRLEMGEDLRWAEAEANYEAGIFADFTVWTGKII